VIDTKPPGKYLFKTPRDSNATNMLLSISTPPGYPLGYPLGRLNMLILRFDKDVSFGTIVMGNKG